MRKLKKKRRWQIGTVLLLLFSSALLAQQRLGDHLGSHQAAQNVQMNTRMVLNASGIAIGTTTIVGGNSVGLQLANGKAIQVTNVTALGQISTPLSGMIAYLTTDSTIHVYRNSNWTALATASLPDGQILIGNSGGNAMPHPLSGDVSMNNTGVTTIGSNKVTDAKLASDIANDALRAVGTNHIKNLSITENKIGANAVTTGKIADGTIDTADLANNSITSVKIADGGVTTSDIADGAVTGSKLSSSISLDASRAVETNHIKDQAVTLTKIGGGATNQILSANASGETAWRNMMAKVASSTNMTLLDNTHLQILRRLIVQNTSTTAIVRFTLPSGYTFNNTLYGNGTNWLDLYPGGNATLFVPQAGKVDILSSNIPPTSTVIAPKWFFGRLYTSAQSTETEIAYGIPAVNGDIDIANSSSGNMTLSGTTGVVLEAGKTYELEAGISAHYDTAPESFLYYQWNITGLGAFGSAGLAIPVTSTYYLNTTPGVARVTYRVAAGSNVVATLKVKSRSPVNYSLWASRYLSYISITELK